MKHKNYLFIVFLGIVLMFICSCNDDYQEQKSMESQNNTSVDTKLSLKEDFSFALAKVLADSKDVRKLIKDEAIKKIDFDYDVLYQLVKNEEIENGVTLEKLLLNYIDKDKLKQIEREIPNLTIFVPNLPENSFSAETWNVNDEIPIVAIRSSSTNDIPTIDAQGNKMVIESDVIPTYPIVVVKENERIVRRDASITRSALSTATFSTRSNPGEEFTFIDNVFDNVNRAYLDHMEIQEAEGNVVTRSRSRDEYPGAGKEEIAPNVAPIFDAYRAYKGTDGWQRDYIYYNITPNTTKGPFNNNFKEHLVSFEMLGDPRTALNKIADQGGDPKYENHSHGNRKYNSNVRTNTGWTDGEFEFKVKVYFGTKSTVGTELISYFRAGLFDLFNDVQTANGCQLEAKQFKLALPLFEWDLNNYSSSIKIAIEEVDDVGTMVNTVSYTHEFATNFGFDASFGTTVKVGAKFGVSTKDSKTETQQITTALGNDELGEVIINFGDDIINSENLVGGVNRNGVMVNKKPDYNNKYSTGWYKIHIAPLKTN